MSESSKRGTPIHESLISAIAIGGFLIAIAVIFGLTPGIREALANFFSDLTGVTYPAFNGQFVLPAPANPAEHPIVYQALFNFMLSIGLLQTVILAMRLWVHSPTSKTAETIGNMIFWLGGAIVASVYLMAGTLSGWFVFWPFLIILGGASLIAQFCVYIIRRRYCR